MTARRAPAIAVVLALCGAPVTASGSVRPQPPEVLLLGGQGAPTVATQRTFADRWYAITVTGTISYNGRLAMQDCGHFDAADAAGWIPYSIPHLDGGPSPCSRMPARASHTYCWTQRGTGAPLVFSMPVTAGAAEDDLGALVVAVEPLAAVAVAGACAVALP
jgi:hypothetical protein